MNLELTHLDLFSGIGGFSLGFENAGFRTLAFCETDPDASLVLAHHWPDVPNLGDIKKLCDTPQSTTEFIRAFGVPWVITGGVPCQPASALGSMRGSADERWLWPEALRVVGALRPRFAVFENPPSVLVLPDFHRVIGEIAALGYDLWWDVIPAAALGAGHLRNRVFFLLADPEHPGRPHDPRQLRRKRAETGGNEHLGQPGGGGETPADGARLAQREPPDQAHPLATGGQTRPESQHHGPPAPHRPGRQTHQRASRHLAAAPRAGQSGNPAPSPDGHDASDAQSQQEPGVRDQHPHGNGRLNLRPAEPAHGHQTISPPHPHQPGLEGQPRHVSDGGRRPRTPRPVATPNLQGRVHCPDWWGEAVTGIPVLVHGLPPRLVEAAVRCAGNSVVPEIAQVIAETLRAMS